MMPRPNVVVARAALLAAAASLLWGCPTKDAPATRFYVLAPLAADTAALPGARRKTPRSVDLVPVQLPQYLDRPQIVTRADANRVELSEYHQWAGNLGKNATRVLARNLSLLLATPDVTLFPRRPSAPADAHVEVEVMQFERGADARVHLSAQWRVIGTGGKAVRTAIDDLESPPVAPGPDMDATVAAMSALLGDLSRTIAQAIVDDTAR